MDAVVFPGKGSQKPGMGRDLAEKFPAARAAFESADRALGIPLTKLCFEGPESDLTATQNAHLRRKAQHASHEPDRQVEQHEADDDEHQQQIQGELDAIRRSDQQRVAGVELHRQRGDDRGDGKQQKPEEETH